MDETSLIKLIDSAFPLEPAPTVTFHQAYLADDSMSRTITDEEWKEAGELDAGRTWRDYTDQELLYHRENLAHFDEQSFVYYLPAFLKFAIRNCSVDLLHEYGSFVGSIVFFTTDLDSYSLARYKAMTPQQSSAFVEYLYYISRHGSEYVASDADRALAKYWSTNEAKKPLIIIP